MEACRIKVHVIGHFSAGNRTGYIYSNHIFYEINSWTLLNTTTAQYSDATVPDSSFASSVEHNNQFQESDFHQRQTSYSRFDSVCRAFAALSVRLNCVFDHHWESGTVDLQKKTD